jgi:hypothetical protein
MPAVGIHVVPVFSAADVYSVVAHFRGAVAVESLLTIASVSPASGTPAVARIPTVADITVVCWHPCCCHPCCYWHPPVVDVPTFTGFFAVVGTCYCICTPCCSLASQLVLALLLFLPSLLFLVSLLCLTSLLLLESLLLLVFPATAACLHCCYRFPCCC